MQNVTITIAGRDYKVEKLKISKNREWRKKFEEPINKLLYATKAFTSLTSKDFEKPTDLFKEMGAVLLLHSETIVRVLLDSVDTIVDAVFAYCPEMSADREWIEANGDDEEMVAAFLEVVKQAFPFISVFQAVGRLGQMAEQTSPSSPEPNGDSGKTN